MGRAFSQAQKFGVEIAIPDQAITLDCGNVPCRILHLRRTENALWRARSWLRPAPVTEGSGSTIFDQFEGSSVHYWGYRRKWILAARR